MSMAARAISSRAASSISLAGMGGTGPLPLPLSPKGERGSVALPFALVAAELVLDRVHQGLPGGLDDVVGDPDRAPGLVAVAGGDEHARLGRRALRLVEDAHLVVEQGHFAQE